ncbi:hypothetical protein DCCM_2992 [Desulfocucumis palustris]|uniref:Uncharacterized protein n=1 Tax=Desulfocucumis palustris TaxID=1898651 RepID=A0A2L2XIX5_9FIRM|nr:hypothetical protein DCCM_2992 [Desulfocucumis palustris]
MNHLSKEYNKCRHSTIEHRLKKIKNVFSHPRNNKRTIRMMDGLQNGIVLFT